MSEKVMKDLIRRMKNLHESGDQEQRHLDADYLLLDALDALGYTQFREEFNKMERWYA